MLSIKEGPVSIVQVATTGLDNRLALWNGIEAREHFPASAQAFYFLDIFKDASSHTEVAGVELSLIDALQQLCYVWPFASGFRMNAYRSGFTVSTNFQSNAAVVRRELESRAGVSSFSASFVFEGEIVLNYSRPPLTSAVALCKNAQADPYFKNMMRYYYLATFEDLAWYIHLYKIRDVLLDALRHSPSAPKKKVKRKLPEFIQAQLNVTKNDWNHFGQALNFGYDLRHPPQGAQLASTISQPEKVALLQLGFTWIRQYGLLMKYPV